MFIILLIFCFLSGFVITCESKNIHILMVFNGIKFNKSSVYVDIYLKTKQT
jgi:hypothetical protein